MHMIKMSVTYMQNTKGVNESPKELITQNVDDQPLFIRCSLEKTAKFKTL